MEDSNEQVELPEESQADTQDKPKASEKTLREIAFEEMPPEQVVMVENAQSQGVKLHAIPVFESVLGDDKTWYVYRTIKRQEWHTLQFEHRQRLQGAPDEITQQEAESMFEDAVVAMCSVAPKIAYKNIGAFDAGAITTLADAVMFSSGFNQNSVPVKL